MMIIPIYRILIVLLAVIGLFGSLKAAIGMNTIESDVIHSLVLWEGVTSYGLSWLGDWRFGQDSWLLSLIPLHFLTFALFGTKPIVVILFGWLIYVATAFVAAAIVWRAGASRAAVIVFLALINFGAYAHAQGFVTYPIAHNITNLFGLSAVFILMVWLERPRLWLLALLGMVLVCGAVSDPWMLPAYNLPLLLLSILLLIHPLSGIKRTQMIMLSGVVAFSILAAQTHLFWLLDFVPNTSFVLVDRSVLHDNVLYFVKNLGGFLSLVPFAESSSLWVALISIFICLYLLIHAMYLAFKFHASIKFSPQVIAYGAFALMSVGALAAAFMLTGIAVRYDGATRYLTNIPYVGIIGLGILSSYVWSSADVVYRYVVRCAFLLFIVASLLSIWPYMQERSFTVDDDGASDMISFLKAHGLSYGYGGYWQANAITLASGDVIRMRSIVFDAQGRMEVDGQIQNSSRWYMQEDIPKGTTEFFVILRLGWGGCYDIDLCLAGLKKQFGDPARVLSNGTAKVLVWHHNLLEELKKPIHAMPNKSYFFGAGGNAVNGVGWSHREPWGIWSDGYRANVKFDVSHIQNKDVALEIKWNCFPRRRQEITLVANGQVMDQSPCGKKNHSDKRTAVVVPRHLIASDGILDLEWRIKRPGSPRRLLLTTDSRKLGFGLISIKFQ